MSIWILIKREIAYKKLVFLTGLLCLAVATAGIVTGVTLLRAHDVTTERILVETEREIRAEMTQQEDHYRRVLRDMGHNVLILNQEQDRSELRTMGYANTYLDYEDVWTLAHDERITTLNHLLPVLQEKIFWQERESEIMLSGIRGQVPVFTKPEFLTEEDEYRSPITERVPFGKADLGYTVATAHDLRPNETIVINGYEFTVNRIYPQRGTNDDITVWIPLDKAQSILGREGKINGIFALECVCDLDELGRIHEEVEAVLPHAKVYEFTSLIAPRAEVRQRAEKAHRQVVASVMANRESMRNEMERVASVAIPLLVSLAVIWIFMLVFNNMRERRYEIGLLRAVGFPRAAILRIFLVKALMMGIAGGVIGCLIGLWAGIGWSGVEPSAEHLTAMIDGRVIAAGLALSPVLSFAAAFIPALMAANLDPAVILREE